MPCLVLAERLTLLTMDHCCLPLAGVYFVVCMALLVISLTETILIVRLVHKQDLQPHVPDWVKHLVLERATILLCIRERQKFYPSRTPSSDISRHPENNDSTGTSCGTGKGGKGRRELASWLHVTITTKGG